MKNILTNIITTLVLVFAFQFANAQASAASNEIVAAQGVETLFLDLGPDVEVKYTKGSRIMIVCNVTIGTPNEKLLQYLIDNGRYGLVVSNDVTNNSITLATKKTNNVLIVKGQECTEKFSYTLLVPETIKFVKKGGATL